MAKTSGPETHSCTSIPPLLPEGDNLFSFHTSVNRHNIPLLFGYQHPFGLSYPQLAVRVFTDGSAPQESALVHRLRQCWNVEGLSEKQAELQRKQLRSAWAFCVEDDEFTHTWQSMPAEGAIEHHHMHTLSLFGGPIEVQTSHNIFMAELQAILRALLSLPIRFHVTVISDSLSSILALQSFSQQTNDRRRLRSRGRPLLTMICSHIRQRCLAGGSVTLQHTSSHKDRLSPESVGNSCADFWADRMREHQTRFARQREQVRMPQIDMSGGEQHVFFRDSAMHCVVVDDVRHAAQQQQQQRNLLAWRRSSSQSLFASSHVLELCRHVMAHGSRRQVQILFLVLSNTIHLSLQPVDTPPSPNAYSSSVLSSSSLSSSSSVSSSTPKKSQKQKREMRSEWCVECDCVCDVIHVLLECPLLESRRLQLYDSMAAVMGEDRLRCVVMGNGAEISLLYLAPLFFINSIIVIFFSI